MTDEIFMHALKTINSILNLKTRCIKRRDENDISTRLIMLLQNNAVEYFAFNYNIDVVRWTRRIWIYHQEPVCPHAQQLSFSLSIYDPNQFRNYHQFFSSLCVIRLLSESWDLKLKTTGNISNFAMQKI